MRHEAAAVANGVFSPYARFHTWATTGSGRGLTRCGGASALAHARNSELRRKLRLPKAFRRGSGAPSRACAWPTARGASSTVQARIGWRPGPMEPTR